MKIKNKNSVSLKYQNKNNSLADIVWIFLLFFSIMSARNEQIQKGAHAPQKQFYIVNPKFKYKF